MGSAEAHIRQFKRNACFEFVDKASRKLFPSGTFRLGKAFLLSCPAGRPISTRPLKNVQIRKASAEDLGIVVACNAEKSREDLFRRYFESGRECYVAISDHKCVGYAWAFFSDTTITFDSYRRSNILMTLPQNSCFVGDGFLHPAWRMRGLFPLLIAHVFGNLSRERSIRTIYNHIDYANENSIRSCLRLGFTLHKTIVYLRMLDAQWIAVYANDGSKKAIQRLTGQTRLSM